MTTHRTPGADWRQHATANHPTTGLGLRVAAPRPASDWLQQPAAAYLVHVAAAVAAGQAVDVPHIGRLRLGAVGELLVDPVPEVLGAAADWPNGDGISTSDSPDALEVRP